jgi:hypothetical protein
MSIWVSSVTKDRWRASESGTSASFMPRTVADNRVTGKGLLHTNGPDRRTVAIMLVWGRFILATGVAVLAPLIAAILALGLGPAAAQSADRLPDDPIGTWVLSCPMAVGQPCIMRHRDWILPPVNGSPSAALEIQLRGDILVPVVTVRGLPAIAALGGSVLIKPTLTIGFDGGRKIEMACESGDKSFSCGPPAAVVPVMGGLLPKARRIDASMTIGLPGVAPLPPQERSLELSGTEAALARLRIVGAVGEALPDVPGLDLRGFIERLLRDMGFPAGGGDLLPRLLAMFGWVLS